MTTGNQAKKIVNLTKDPQAPVNRLSEMKPDKPLSELMNETADRYMSIIKRSMPEFTTTEWCLIFDALRPTWTADEHHTAQMPGEIAEAMSSDRLDRKWEIDGPRLKSRIDRLSYASRLAIGEMNEIFWNSGAQDNYQQVISDIIAMFPAPPRQQPPQPRTDRISPDRVGPKEPRPTQGRRRDQTPEASAERDEAGTQNLPGNDPHGGEGNTNEAQAPEPGTPDGNQPAGDEPDGNASPGDPAPENQEQESEGPGTPARGTPPPEDQETPPEAGGGNQQQRGLFVRNSH